eukprot:m.163970 g.163970  ORF g.163970 m.163970 type:complete len:251 (+) comp12362_c0_seq1:54-806(+)
MGKAALVTLGMVATAAAAPYLTPGTRSLTAATCSATDGEGNVYDMSPLIKDTYYVSQSGVYAQYNFYFNICEAIKVDDVPDSKCPDGETSTCEIEDVDGKLGQSDMYGSVHTQKFSWQEGVKSPVFLYETTAGPCSRSEGDVTSKVYIECDEEAEEPIVSTIDEDYWECKVSLLMKTKVACEGEPPAIKYRCAEDECVEAPTGVDFEECSEFCGELKYRCVADRCVVEPTGIPKGNCEDFCGLNTNKTMA